ncbi:MAG: CfrBI family restriction endonuclease [Alphaproteobacteria bacterium]
MRIKANIIEAIIRKLLQGDDYRSHVIALINAEFFDFAIDFFKKVATAKLNNKTINVDWYKENFLNRNLPSKDIAINSGLNMKTINNMYNSEKKEIVIDASYKNYDILYDSIKTLADNENDLSLTLTIKLNDVGVDLNISESLIVINTLAIKRKAIGGGLWSGAGKLVERPLMLTLCRLFEVNEKYYKEKPKNKKSNKNLNKNNFKREVDFYLQSNEKEYRCEVKLMGKGNPEVADSVFARASNVFIADKLSDTNKKQLTNEKIEWVELRNNGFKKFETILQNCNIPYKPLPKDINQKLQIILKDILY